MENVERKKVVNEQISIEFYDVFFNTVRKAVMNEIEDDLFEEIDIDYEKIKKELLEKMKLWGYIKI